MKKRIAGEEIRLIAACLIGLIFLGNNFGQAFSTWLRTRDRDFATRRDFAARTEQGLLDYLKLRCDGGRGNINDCDDLAELLAQPIKETCDGGRGNKSDCDSYKQQGGQ